MIDLGAPPADDEIEFSAFGPGHGQCLLIHLGLGEWMMVDSCVDGGRLPALDYLESLGVDPSQSVKLLVATHWHDDHIRGISEALGRCSQASFACSVALDNPELLSAIASQPSGRFGKLMSGIDEMRNALEHLDRIGQLHRLVWAVQQRTLYQRGGVVECMVSALAPSDFVVERAHSRIMDLVVGSTGRVPDPESNHSAVVLWVEVGRTTMLLGADLQETGDELTGWSAVVGCRRAMDQLPAPSRLGVTEMVSSPAGRGARAELFAVPHHGSSNAHHSQVWNELLVERPQAIVCPSQPGRPPLPSPSDIDRLCGLGNVHLTAPVDGHVSIRRGRPGRIADSAVGRVTLRRHGRSGPDWRVNYGGPAMNACREGSVIMSPRREHLAPKSNDRQAPQDEELDIQVMQDDGTRQVPRDRRPQRTLVEVLGAREEFGSLVLELVIPAWRTVQVISIPASDFDTSIASRSTSEVRGLQFFADINVWASAPGDLFFENVELAEHPPEDFLSWPEP